MRLAAIALLIASPAAAQTTYDVTQGIGQITGQQGAAPTFLGDDAVRQVSIGFDFTFFDQTFSQVYVSSNGFVSFNYHGDLCCNGWRIDEAPRNSIYAYWTDLIGGANPYWRSSADQFIAGWYGTKEYGTQNSNTFEISLFPSGEIRIDYGDVNNTYHTVTAGITGPTYADNILLSYGQTVNQLDFTGFSIAPSLPAEPALDCNATPNDPQCPPAMVAPQVVAEIIPVQEPAQEPAQETVEVYSEPSAVEQAQESEEAATETVAEVVAEPAAEPAEEPVAEPVTETVAEQAAAEEERLSPEQLQALTADVVQDAAQMAPEQSTEQLLVSVARIDAKGAEEGAVAKSERAIIPLEVLLQATEAKPGEQMAQASADVVEVSAQDSIAAQAIEQALDASQSDALMIEQQIPQEGEVSIRSQNAEAANFAQTDPENAKISAETIEAVKLDQAQAVALDQAVVEVSAKTAEQNTAYVQELNNLPSIAQADAAITVERTVPIAALIEAASQEAAAVREDSPKLEAIEMQNVATVPGSVTIVETQSEEPVTDIVLEPAAIEQIEQAQQIVQQIEPVTIPQVVAAVMNEFRAEGHTDEYEAPPVIEAAAEPVVTESTPASQTTTIELLNMMPEQQQLQQPNDLGDLGGNQQETMAQLSTVPEGYGQYTQVRLPDAPFYKPRDIYRNKRLNDANLQMYGMMSEQDSKWNEMTGDQYE